MTESQRQIQSQIKTLKWAIKVEEENLRRALKERNTMDQGIVNIREGLVRDCDKVKKLEEYDGQ